MYRVGFPGWKIAARFNVPLVLRLEVAYDKEAEVFVARSDDLPGLIVESPSQDRLVQDTFDCIDMLMAEMFKTPLRHRPAPAWNGEFAAA